MIEITMPLEASHKDGLLPPKKPFLEIMKEVYESPTIQNLIQFISHSNKEYHKIFSLEV